MKSLFKVEAYVKLKETYIFYIKQSTLNPDDMKCQIIEFMNENYREFDGTSDTHFNFREIILLKITLLNKESYNRSKYCKAYSIE